MKGLPHEARFLVTQLTPNEAEYSAYLKKGEAFIRDYDERFPVIKARFKSSVIFKKKYLVVYVDDQWIQEVAPDLVAFVMPDLHFLSLDAPPAALVPASKEKSRSVSFQSILEHEFVHLNQWIKGHEPGTDFRGKDLSEDFIRYFNSEFQAYFIQYSYYPAAFKSLEKKRGVLRDTCAIKALNQATIKMAEAISRDNQNLNVEKTFSHLQAKVKKSLGKMGVDKVLVEELSINFPVFFMKALFLASGGSAPSSKQ